jgi:DNA-nicking Smr family endonuclease
MFRAAMADVTRLAEDHRGRVPARRSVQVGDDAGRPAAAQPNDDHEPERGSFLAPGVDRRELRRLRRGDYPAGETLDLHGQTAASATAAVARFVASVRARHRCVAIVHGRGLHSGERGAVLKQRVRDLLRAHPAVLAFADAPAREGGDGAVFVLLRR